MFKITITVVIIFLFFGICGVIAKPNGKETRTDKDLENYSIGTKSTYRGINDGKWQKFLFLYNLKDKRIVAVMAFTKDFKKAITLNPRYKIVGSDFVYGPIPNLNEFTIEIANSLFGRSLSSTGNSDSKVNTYKLYMPKKPHICYLDLNFLSNKLQKYKFRTPEYSSNWIEVKNRGAQRSTPL